MLNTKVEGSYLSTCVTVSAIKFARKNQQRQNSSLFFNRTSRPLLDFWIVPKIIATIFLSLTNSKKYIIYVVTRYLST